MPTTFLVPKNNASSKLAAAIGTSATSLSVASGEGARFPSTYPFNITIDSEIIQVSNRSGDTMTITRAQEGTAAATHSQNATAQLNITAKSISDLNAAVNALENNSGNFSKVIWLDTSVSVLYLVTNNSVDWTDIDLTSATSANAKFAIVQMRLYVSVQGSTNCQFSIRKNGTAAAYPYTSCIDYGYTENPGFYKTVTAIIGLDSGQVFEYKATVGTGALTVVFNLDVLGYIE